MNISSNQIELAKEIKQAIKDYSPDWKNEYLEDYTDEEGNIFLDVTIATNDDCTEYAIQTGDNSFTGSCYLLPHWSVGGFSPDTDLDELAEDLCENLWETVES